jgi:hypothetical protein
LKNVIHLGANVYTWGEDAQDRLLVDCLGTAADELRSRGLLELFWYDRFDARGPHLFALFTVPTHAAESARALLADRIEDHLRKFPSTLFLSREEVETRHAECRGKALAAVDRQPGLVENNTYCLFEQPPHGYPFRVSQGLAGEAELWGFWDDLVHWVLQQIRNRPENSHSGTAVRWFAQLDQAVASTGEATSFWRYYATTLLPPLTGRLATEEEEVLRALPTWVGDKNRKAFSRIWDSSIRSLLLWPHFAQLVTLATREEGEASLRWNILREVVHCTLKQLGVPVSLHVPLVLFAWERGQNGMHQEVS